jgi:4'-phosphopantetheinyl transferase EntD
LGLAALTPVTPIRFGDESEASDQLPWATPPVQETPPAVGEAKPALPQEFATPPAKPEPLSAAGAKPKKQSEILQKKKCVAIKTASSHAGQAKSSVYGGRRNPANPLAIVGRAVNSFTTRIAKDLRRIPLRLSSLMAGH